MAATETDTETEGRGFDVIELISVALLGLAALLTAFAAFRSALKDGEALDGYTQSTQLATQASDLNGQGDVEFANDQQLFLEWSKAAVEGDEELAAYIQETLMTEELWAAISWWAEQEDASSPFVEENPDWTNVFWDDAAALYDESATVYAAAKVADDNGDEYQLALVFFAATLFFAGVVNVFKDRRIQAVLLVISFGGLAIGGITTLNAL